MRLAKFAFITGCLLAVSAAPEKLTPVAVELFTSQGCSSCPPADALMERLAKEPNIIAITRPVTYWDRLGWKDTLAREENTRLQRAYASKGGEGSGVYTPQTVVQGDGGVVGSQEGALRAMIATEKRKPGPSVSARATKDGGRQVTIGAQTNASGSVSIIAMKGETIVRIGRGENGGRTVRYTNVVIAETGVGRWSGKAQEITVPASAMRVAGADRYAIIIRAGDAGRILAARYL